MKYELRVTDKEGNFLDIVNGDDVHEVLIKAAKLRTKKFLGYYYEKQKIIYDTCLEYAQKLTEQISNGRSNTSEIVYLNFDKSKEISWDIILTSFYDKNPKPEPNNLVDKPIFEKIPPEPKKDDDYYKYKFNVKDELIPFRKGKSISDLNAEFKRDHLLWEKKKESIDARNRDKERAYNENSKYAEENYLSNLEKWINKKSEVTDRMRTFKEGYQNKKGFAVEKYCELVLKELDNSTTIENKKFALKYVEGSKFLFLELILPPKNDFNSIKEIAYSKADEKFIEVLYSDYELEEKYRSILYNKTLTALYSLFFHDKVDAIEEIGIRGVVEIENADKKICAPIISLSAKKENFLNLEFEKITIHECFTMLNGVYSDNYIEQFHSEENELSAGDE